LEEKFSLGLATMAECIPIEKLLRWLADELSPAEAAAVDVHVADCVSCHSRLDQATEHAGLRGCLLARQRQQAPDGDEGALAELLRELRATLPIGRKQRDPPAQLTRPSAYGPAPLTANLGMIGTFRLLDELGRGGMGIVYRAWDEPLSRLVAIKVLLAEQAGEAERKSLVREAQLAACFQNDHAVMIHSVVNPEGAPPYLVMEYVHGPTLAELIGSNERLEPRRVATLIAQIALALEAAHAAGLVHRDVKPSNVLIEENTGRAKITDFGLARAQAMASGLTRDGVVAGTPTYMSPEQARGENQLDARTDVYSLGATLYEALTGEVPFRGTPHLVLRQVIEEDPRPLRQYSDQVPRDLETICLKATAREPARRYQTAGELAGDLHRWLGGLPILARPTGRLERSVLWCRRNPRVASLAASLFATVSLGFLAVVWQWRRAEHNAQSARLHLKDSEASFERARRAVDGYYTRFYEQGVVKVPGLEKVRHEVVGDMLQYYRDFLDQHQNDPALRRELAETCLRLGLLTFDQGNKSDALELLQRSSRDYEQLARAAPEDKQIQDRMAFCLNHMGLLESELGKAESAVNTFGRGMAILNAMIGADPDNNQLRRRLAVFYGNLANLYHMRLKDEVEARRAYGKALDVQQDLVDRDPSQIGFKYDLAMTCNNLALMTDDRLKALGLLERALAIRKRLVEQEPTNAQYRRNLARTHQNIGVFQLGLGRAGHGLDSLRESRRLLEEVVAEHSSVTRYQGDLGQALYNLGDTLAAQGASQEAIAILEHSRKIYRKLLHANPDDAGCREGLLLAEQRLAVVEKRPQKPQRAGAATIPK
jgi:serine/threonine protein kinase/tetratricopeptide (TPR) repeat protein